MGKLPGITDKEKVLTKADVLQEGLDEVLRPAGQYGKVCPASECGQCLDVLFAEKQGKVAGYLIDHRRCCCSYQMRISLVECIIDEPACLVLSDKAFCPLPEECALRGCNPSDQALLAVVGCDGVEGSIKVEDDARSLSHERECSRRA